MVVYIGITQGRFIEKFLIHVHIFIYTMSSGPLNMVKNIRCSLPFFLSLILLLVAASVCSSPTLDDYAALPTTTHMTLSPSGELVAFRQRKENRDVVLITSVKEMKSIAAFDVSSIELNQLYFLDEKNLIVKASQNTRVLGFEGSIDVSTAFIYNIKKDKLKQLLKPGDKIYLGQSGLGEIAAVSKDKKYIYMPAYSGSSKTNVPPPYSLMRVNIKSPDRPKVIVKGKASTINYFVSNDGDVLAREDFSNERDVHKVYSYLNGKSKLIFEEKTPIRYKSFVGFTPDQKSLVMLASSSKTNRVDYFTLSLESGEILPTEWSKEGMDIESAINDINNVVEGVRYSGFNPSYRFFNESVQKKMDTVLNYFPDHSVGLHGWSADWDKILISVEGSSDPGSYYLFSGGKKLIKLTSIRPGLAQEDIHPIGKVTYKARDGLRIPTLLTIPKNTLSSMKNLPAIIFPHGGPESYDRIGFDGFTQALANEGYLVIQPQFRGSEGFGINHTLAGRGEWGKKMQDDLSDAVAFFVKKGMINPKRVCIAGMSYGGYAALAGGAFTPKLYNCIVSVNGVSHLPKMLERERKDHGSKHSVVSYWEEVIAKGDSNTAFLKSISPYYVADNFVAPTLLIHGQKDDVVNIKQSRLMNKALEKASKAVRFVELEKETHYLDRPETRAIALKEMVSFINEHIGK